MTVEKVLDMWTQSGKRVDAYILPQPSGDHSIGIRYGKQGSEYLSPMGERSKVQALLDKYLTQTPHQALLQISNLLKSFDESLANTAQMRREFLRIRKAVARAGYIPIPIE
jgi:hypothetical protein